MSKIKSFKAAFLCAVLSLLLCGSIANTTSVQAASSNNLPENLSEFASNKTDEDSEDVIYGGSISTTDPYTIDVSVIDSKKYPRKN